MYSKTQERGAWDVVATCFFIDTARNVVRYIETINALLPVGGLWVNAGPLLWHFEHDEGLSIELSLDEVLGLLPRMGFAIEVRVYRGFADAQEHRTLPLQTYTGTTASMLSHLYAPEFFVCRKVADHAMAPSV